MTDSVFEHRSVIGWCVLAFWERQERRILDTPFTVSRDLITIKATFGR